jgi:hypothetical protein
MGMTDSSVEYNVVINGVLPGNKPGAVAEAVAPVLGLLPSDALHLFNGVAHTVLQRTDLSAAASFQAQLKAMGIDASVAVFEDRTPGAAKKSPPPEAAPAPSAEEEAAADIPEPAAEAPSPAEPPPAEPPPTEPPLAEPPPAEPPPEPVEPPPEPVEPPPEAVEPAPEPAEPPLLTMDFEAEEEAPAPEPVEAPASDGDKGGDNDFELDLSLVDQAQSASEEPESEDIFDTFKKEAAEREDEEQAQQPAQTSKAAEPEPEPEPKADDPLQVPDLDLDEMFDTGEETQPEPPAPQPQPDPPAPPPAAEPPALAMAEEPAEAVASPAAVVTEEVTAVDTGVDAARSLDASPIQNAAPGSNMLCPSCNTLQPRADECPGCGAVVNAASGPDTGKEKTKLPPQLPQAAIVTAAVAALLSAGVWLALGYATKIDTGPMALVTGVLAGLACGLRGGRGAQSGASVAGLALVAIAGVAYLLPREGAKDLPAPPQPDPVEVWSEALAPQWYDEAVDDAEFFMTIDGSSAAVRKFMIEHDYTKARRADRIPTADLQYFYDVDAKDLTWLVENQPDYDTWRQRMLGHLGGRQRVRLNVSAPPIEPPPPVVTGLQAMYMLAGAIAAFVLGFIGLRRKA